MPGLQDLVNRWIRVNQKGGARFPDDEELASRRDVQIRHVPSLSSASATASQTTTPLQHTSFRSADNSSLTTNDSPYPAPPSMAHGAPNVHQKDGVQAVNGYNHQSKHDSRKSQSSSPTEDSIHRSWQHHAHRPRFRGRSAASEGGTGSRAELTKFLHSLDHSSPYVRRSSAASRSSGGSASGVGVGGGIAKSTDCAGEQRSVPIEGSIVRKHSPQTTNTTLPSSGSFHSESQRPCAANGFQGATGSHSISNRPGSYGGMNVVRGRRNRDQESRLTRTNSHSDLLKEKYDEVSRDNLLQRQQQRMQSFFARAHFEPQHQGDSLNRSSPIGGGHAGGSAVHNEETSQHSAPGAGTRRAAGALAATGAQRLLQHRHTGERPSPSPPTRVASSPMLPHLKRMDQGTHSLPPPSPRIRRGSGGDHSMESGSLSTSQASIFSQDSPLLLAAATVPILQTSPLPSRKIPGQNNFARMGAGLKRPDSEGSAAGTEQQCNKCQMMEKTLLLMQSDIEYLRSLATASECIESLSRPSPSEASDAAPCTCLEHEVPLQVPVQQLTLCPVHRDSASDVVRLPQQKEIGAGGDAVRKASMRLLEVTTGHKKQMEHFTKEMARWQHQTHLKTSKFALMCKDINEESAVRKQDTAALEAELEEVQAERNELSSQLDSLRTKLNRYVNVEEENKVLRKKMCNQGSSVVENFGTALSERDLVIEDLSKRLRHTNDTLRMERQQHMQRRQIIFPNTRSQTEQGLLDQLAQAKEEARSSKASLEELKIDARAREKELEAKCDMLSKQLKALEHRIIAEGCSLSMHE